MPTNPPAVLLTEAQLDQIGKRSAVAFNRSTDEGILAEEDRRALLGHIRALTAEHEDNRKALADCYIWQYERLTASIRTICEDHAEYETRAELARRILAVIEGA